MEKDEIIREAESNAANRPEIRTIEELSAVFDKWLLIKDRQVVKLVAATVIANRLPIDPVWMFLVAPPGGSKTELIRALGKIKDVYPISNLTAQTFVSGLTTRKNIDLLPKVTNKTVSFKDFTTIMEGRKDSQADILSQLREIYDGEYNREYGSGKSFHWKGKMGFIAGVTPIMDKYYSVHKVLGERFLQYRVLQPDRREVLEKINSNISKQFQMREELMDSFASYLGNVRLPDLVAGEELPRLPKEVNKRIIEVAVFVSQNRSTVIRDEYSRDKNIIFVPGKEMSTRIYAQLTTLGTALMILNGKNEFKDEDYAILFKVGFDSIHYLKKEILDILRSYKGWVRTSQVAIDSGYSTHTVRFYLEELTVLETIERLKPRERLDVWRLRADVRDQWAFAENDAVTALVKFGWKVDKYAEDAVGNMNPDEAASGGAEIGQGDIPNDTPLTDEQGML